MIPKQNDIILAIGRGRHLCLAELAHAISLTKRYGSLRSRIFCNNFWLEILVRRLQRLGKLKEHFETNQDGKVIPWPAPHYCLTAQGASHYDQLASGKLSKAARWASGA